MKKRWEQYIEQLYGRDERITDSFKEESVEEPAVSESEVKVEQKATGRNKSLGVDEISVEPTDQLTMSTLMLVTVASALISIKLQMFRGNTEETISIERILVCFLFCVSVHGTPAITSVSGNSPQSQLCDTGVGLAGAFLCECVLPSPL